MINFIEKNLGIQLSEVKLREAVALSDEANKYYIEILEMLKNRPSPISFRDMCGHVFRRLYWPGQKGLLNF